MYINEKKAKIIKFNTTQFELEGITNVAVFFKGTCMDLFMYGFWQFKLQDSHNSIT